MPFLTEDYQSIVIRAITTNVQSQTTFQLQNSARDHPQLADKLHGQDFSDVVWRLYYEKFAAKNRISGKGGFIAQCPPPPKYATGLDRCWSWVKGKFNRFVKSYRRFYGLGPHPLYIMAYEWKGVGSAIYAEIILILHEVAPIIQLPLALVGLLPFYGWHLYICTYLTSEYFGMCSVVSLHQTHSVLHFVVMKIYNPSL